MVSVHTGNGSIDRLSPVHKSQWPSPTAEIMGNRRQRSGGFGDGGNDIEMLRQAGFSFCNGKCR
ncbi:HAD hydrolase family protein [Shigella flexneri]